MAKSAGKFNIIINNLIVPVDTFLATDSETVSFKTVSPNGNLVKNLAVVEEVIDKDNVFDTVTSAKIPKKDCLKGIPVAKDKYAVFSEEEISFLNSKKDDGIYIQAFAKSSAIDPIRYNKSYYLEPELAGIEAFGLLADRMKKSKKIAIATMVKKGKDVPVAIRHYEGGLILQTLYRNDEVRDMPKVQPTRSSKENGELIDQVINELTVSDIDESLIDNDYNTRVMALARKKINETNSITKALKS